MKPDGVPRHAFPKVAFLKAPKPQTLNFSGAPTTSVEAETSAPKPEPQHPKARRAEIALVNAKTVKL